MYDQEFTLYVFNQHNLTNEQYSDRFNTNVDVGEDICITIQYCVLTEDTAQETVKTFDDLGSDEKVRKKG